MDLTGIPDAEYLRALSKGVLSALAGDEEEALRSADHVEQMMVGSAGSTAAADSAQWIRAVAAWKTRRIGDALAAVERVR